MSQSQRPPASLSKIVVTFEDGSCIVHKDSVFQVDMSSGPGLLIVHDTQGDHEDTFYPMSRLRSWTFTPARVVAAPFTITR